MKPKNFPARKKLRQILAQRQVNRGVPLTADELLAIENERKKRSKKNKKAIDH